MLADPDILGIFIFAILLLISNKVDRESLNPPSNGKSVGIEIIVVMSYSMLSKVTIAGASQPCASPTNTFFKVLWRNRSHVPPTQKEDAPTGRGDHAWWATAQQ